MANQPGYSLAYIAWRNVSRKLFRNFVLLLAVSLLVSLLVFAMLFNRAVQEDIKTATKRLGADIVLVPAEAKGKAEEFILESQEKTFYMDEFVFEAVMELDEISSGTFQVYLETLDAGCCSIDEGQVVAFDPDSDFVVTPWLEGAPDLGAGDVYVGSYVYEYLGLINTASLFGQGVKVVGHLQETGTGLDHGIFMRYDDLAKVSSEAAGDYKKGTISIIFLKVKEGLDVGQVVAKIRNVNPTIGIMTRGSIGSDVRTTLRDIVRVFSITISMASLLAVMLAWSTFTAMANERQREVGILRAIGARKSHIISMFLAEAVLVSVFGGLLGVVMGHYLIAYLAADFNLLSRLDVVAGISWQNSWVSFLALAAGVGVCLLGALLPVIRLAGLEPLLAIKEE